MIAFMSNYARAAQGSQFSVAATCSQILSVLFPAMLAVRLSAVDVISPNRLPLGGKAFWQQAGVPGGIPTTRTHLINVALAPYLAPRNGVDDDTTAINEAIAAASPEDVVYLPAGQYVIQSNGVYLKSNITMRGDGDTTVLHMKGTWQNIRMGVSNDFTAEVACVGSYSTGANDISVGSGQAAGYAAGDMVRIRNTVNDDSVPIISVNGSQGIQSQISRVTGVSGDHITISPTLAYAIDSARVPKICRNQGTLKRIGLEDLKIDNSDRAAEQAVFMSNVVDSWVKNVTSYNCYGVHFYTVCTLQCEFRHCRIEESQTHGPNNAGIKTNPAWNMLIVDNIFIKLFPSVQLDGAPGNPSADGFGGGGNVVIHNFSYDSYRLNPTLAGASYSNHGPHEIYDLFEGNIGEKLQLDGYFGGVSKCTALRNWITGNGVTATENFRCIDFCRFGRTQNVVGNLLGTTGHTYTVDAGDTNFIPYGERLIYRLGFPNVDNGGYTGHAEISTGDPWIHWQATGTLSTRTSDTDGIVTVSPGLAASYNTGQLNPSLNFWLFWAGNARNIPLTSINGNDLTFSGGVGSVLPPQGSTVEIFPGPGGWQEYDRDVVNTILLKGNYNTQDAAVPASESIGSDTIADSYFYDARPSWFGDLAWPPFDPVSHNMDFSAIPAGYRYVHGNDPSPGETPPKTPTNFKLKDIINP